MPFTVMVTVAGRLVAAGRASVGASVAVYWKVTSRDSSVPRSSKSPDGLKSKLPSLFRITDPWAGSLTRVAVVTVWPSTGSESLSSTPGRSMPAVSGVSSSVEYVSFAAVGGSLTGLTVIVTVASLLSASPSLALKVKLSVP